MENKIYSLHPQQVVKYIGQIFERPCFIYSCQCLKEKTVVAALLRWMQPADGTAPSLVLFSSEP